MKSEWIFTYILPKKYLEAFYQGLYEEQKVDGVLALLHKLKDVYAQKSTEYLELLAQNNQRLKGILSEMIKTKGVEDPTKVRAVKEQLQRTVRYNIKYETLKMSARILESIVEARADFITTNKEKIQSLLNHYYKFYEGGMTPYKDDLTKEWLDLMPSDFYFMQQPRPIFTGDFANLESEFEILGVAPEFQTLIININQYHQIPKMDRSAAKQRIEILRRIVGEASALHQEFATQGIDQPIIKNIAATCSLKS